MKWHKKAVRTQAIRLVVGLLFGAVLILLPQGRAQARTRLDAKAVMQLPVSELVLQKAEVISIVQKLEQQFNVPISFIQAMQDNPTTIDVVDGAAHDVLDQILRQNPMYRVRQLKGRLILMPTGTQFDTKIGNIAIKNVPREQATHDYLAILSKQKGFEQVHGLAMAGSWTTLYTAPVTLDRKATVVEHFVELLGKDALLLFSLHKGAHENVGYLFWYGNVRERPPVFDGYPVGFYLPSARDAISLTGEMVHGLPAFKRTPASLTQIAGGSPFLIAIRFDGNVPLGPPLTFQITSSLPIAVPSLFSSFADSPAPQQIIVNYTQVVQKQVQRPYQTAVYILVETNQVLHDVILNFIVSEKVGFRVIHRVRGSILITRLP